MSFEKFLDVNWNTFVPILPTENFLSQGTFIPASSKQNYHIAA